MLWQVETLNFIEWSRNEISTNTEKLRGRLLFISKEQKTEQIMKIAHITIFNYIIDWLAKHYIIISQNDLKYTLYNSRSSLSVSNSMQKSLSLSLFLSQSLSLSMSLYLSAYREVKFLLSKNVLHIPVLFITQPWNNIQYYTSSVYSIIYCYFLEEEEERWEGWRRRSWWWWGGGRGGGKEKEERWGARRKKRKKSKRRKRRNID